MYFGWSILPDINHIHFIPMCCLCRSAYSTARISSSVRSRSMYEPRFMLNAHKLNHRLCFLSRKFLTGYRCRHTSSFGDFCSMYDLLLPNPYKEYPRGTLLRSNLTISSSISYIYLWHADTSGTSCHVASLSKDEKPVVMVAMDRSYYEYLELSPCCGMRNLAVYLLCSKGVLS